MFEHIKTMRNLWPELNRNIFYKVGNGSKALFRKENWIENETLMILISNLFSLNTNSEGTVADAWLPREWNIVFRKPLNDWRILSYGSTTMMDFSL